MKTTVIGILCLLSACTTSAISADAPLDPTGSWDTVQSWTGGDCGLSGTLVAQTQVLQAGDHYVIQGTATRTINGTVACSTSMCELVFTEAGAVSADQEVTVWVQLFADDDGQISGSGYATFQSSRGSCQQHFVATGRRNEGVVISP